MDIDLSGRNLIVRLTKSAERALAKRSTPLLVEMELLFSCLVRKQVRFIDELGDDALLVRDKLYIRFRPVVTSVCSVAEHGRNPPKEEFPISDPHAYVPRWLEIDFRRGCWRGEFGYKD